MCPDRPVLIKCRNVQPDREHGANLPLDVLEVIIEHVLSAPDGMEGCAEPPSGLQRLSQELYREFGTMYPKSLFFDTCDLPSCCLGVDAYRPRTLLATSDANTCRI